MNDNLKFRYYNEYSGKLVCPDNYQNVDAIYECIKQQVSFDEDIKPLPFNHTGDGLIFSQCMGKKDKNGKDLYVGDIVEVRYPYECGYETEEMTVVYNEDCCAFGFQNKKGFIEYLTDSNIPYNPDDYEIIGHCYQPKGREQACTEQ